MQSFRALLDRLARVARHKVRLPARPETPLYDQVTTPDAFQRELLARVGLRCLVTGRQKASA